VHKNAFGGRAPMGWEMAYSSTVLPRPPIPEFMEGLTGKVKARENMPEERNVKR